MGQLDSYENVVVVVVFVCLFVCLFTCLHVCLFVCLFVFHDSTVNKTLVISGSYSVWGSALQHH